MPAGGDAGKARRRRMLTAREQGSAAWVDDAGPIASMAYLQNQTVWQRSTVHGDRNSSLTCRRESHSNAVRRRVHNHSQRLEVPESSGGSAEGVRAARRTIVAMRGESPRCSAAYAAVSAYMARCCPFRGERRAQRPRSVATTLNDSSAVGQRREGQAPRREWPASPALGPELQRASEGLKGKARTIESIGLTWTLRAVNSPVSRAFQRVRCGAPRLGIARARLEARPCACGGGPGSRRRADLPFTSPALRLRSLERRIVLRARSSWRAVALWRPRDCPAVRTEGVVLPRAARIGRHA